MRSGIGEPEAERQDRGKRGRQCRQQIKYPVDRLVRHVAVFGKVLFAVQRTIGNKKLNLETIAGDWWDG
jgi:hypothetical protein